MRNVIFIRSNSSMLNYNSLRIGSLLQKWKCLQQSFDFTEELLVIVSFQIVNLSVSPSSLSSSDVSLSMVCRRAAASLNMDK